MMDKKQMHLETFREDVDLDADDQIFDEIKPTIEPNKNILLSLDEETQDDSTTDQEWYQPQPLIQYADDQIWLEDVNNKIKQLNDDSHPEFDKLLLELGSFNKKETTWNIYY